MPFVCHTLADAKNRPNFIYLCRLDATRKLHGRTSMALTNFSKLHTEQKKVWSRDVWKRARDISFTNQFTGKGHTAMITRITELTKSERGSEAIIHLIADIEGDGVTDDYELEGHEDEIKSFDQKIQIDQLRNAVRHKGKFEHQKTVINFRDHARDQLAYWLSDRIDQMTFLALSGVGFDKTNKGADRPAGAMGYKLSDLSFAADVTPPSAKRHFRATANGLVAGNTAEMTANDKLSYRTLVEAHAYMKDNYIRGVGARQDMYHVFLTPQGLAQLKLDPDFMANVRHAGRRGDANPLFKGAETLYVDGLLIHEFRHVFNTRNAADGSKWGAAGDVDGQRVLMCGAQALATCDLGAGEWNEKTFDYGNQNGIAYGKIFGMKKPKWKCKASGTEEDFGVVCIDTSLSL